MTTAAAFLLTASAASAAAPANVALPTVTPSSGLAVGTVLTATTGSWANAPTAYVHEWQRCDATCQDINPLPNPGFDSVAAPWKGYGATVTADTAQLHTGPRALKVVTTASVVGGFNLAVGSEIPVKGSTTYTWALWVYSPASLTFRVAWDESDASNNWLGSRFATVIHPGGGWALLSLTATTRSNTRLLNPYFDNDPQALHPSITFWVDDLFLSTANVYTVTQADAGKKLKVRVLATNSSGTGTADSAMTGAVGTALPTSTTKPAVAGVPTVGQTLTTDDGTWANSPSGYAVQWLRCDAAGAGCAATGDTNLLLNPDLESNAVPWTGYGASVAQDGSRFHCGSKSLKVVTAVNNVGGFDLLAGNEVPVSGGTAYTFSLWVYFSGSPTPFKIAWDESDAANNWLGNRFANVTHPGTGWALLSFTAATRAGAALVNPYFDTNPQTTRPSLTFWADCLELVANGPAAAHSLVLKPTHEGSAVRSEVTATNGAGSATARSDATAAVAAGPPPPTPVPVNNAPPLITGAAQVGQTLTASQGGWTNSPTSYAYEWFRCSAGCASVQGPSAANTYLVQSGDLGLTIKVRVVATNAGGPSAPADSAQTPAVVAASSNLLTNPGFETQVAPWVGYGTMSFVRAGTQKHSGSWSLQIANKNKQVGGLELQPFGSEIPVSGSTQYRFSLWVYSGCACTYRIAWDEDDTNLNWLGNRSATVAVPASVWTQVTLVKTTRAAARFVNPYFDNDPQSKHPTVIFYVDDLSLTTP